MSSPRPICSHGDKEQEDWQTAIETSVLQKSSDGHPLTLNMKFNKEWTGKNKG